MPIHLVVVAIAFQAVANIFGTGSEGSPRIFFVAFQAFAMSPAAAGRVVFTPRCRDLANFTVFRCHWNHRAYLRTPFPWRAIRGRRGLCQEGWS